MRVSFQGIHGAYSEAAARKGLGARCRTLPRETFEEVFGSVERGEAHRGIIPIENSLAGSIHQNYDLLLAHHLHIVDEVYLRIEHVLMCHPSTSFPRLRVVRSHPQALAQCSLFFRRYTSIKPAAYYDTAAAAKSIADERNADTGAIASTHAAHLYGLKILKKNIEDLAGNYTRFLVLGKSPWLVHSRAQAKTSIVFIPKRNEVGILHRILGAFSTQGVDLLKIESRPDPKVPFEYLFYLDLAGSPREQAVSGALRQLREMTRFYRLLGTYPAHRYRTRR